MDIRLIHGFPPAECRSLGEGKILMLTEAGIDRRVDCPVLKASLYWGEENRLQEIEPELSKHHIGEFHFAEVDRSYAYFIHLEPVQELEDRAEFIIYRYHLKESRLQELMRFIDRPSLYRKDKQLKVFILNSSYLLIQFAYLKSTLDNTHEGYYDFEHLLYDMDQKLKYQVTEDDISRYGIETILPLERNLCAVRIGYSQLAGGFSSFTKADAPVEQLGVIPVTQLISELILSKHQLSMDMICSVQFYETISGLRRIGDRIIFSRRFREKEEYEMVVYQWKTREIQRFSYLNTNGSTSVQELLIQNRPYLLQQDGSHSKLIPLDHKSSEIRFQNHSSILHVAGSLICTEIVQRQLFTGKQRTIYEVYHYPDMKILIREKGSHLYWLEASDQDLIYMFISEEASS